jgi:thiamine biosynthesis lipoprotein
VTASVSFPAIGTTALVATEHKSDLLHARGILAAQLDQLDRACSRFRPDSELVLANARAGKPVRVSRLLATAVQAALEAAVETDGLVDPTLGAQLRAAGYDRTFSLVRDRDRWTIAPSSPRAYWAEVELDRSTGLLRTPRGCELDLGATAKALAADHAASTISAAIGSWVLVSLGGDIAVAGDTPAGGVSIRVGDDHAERLDAPGPCVALASGGIATSSTVVRSWKTDRGTAHHVIDPRTGLPARTPWRTITVAAGSCLDANVASTAAVVLGTDAVDWLRQRDLPSRLVAHDGSVVHVGSWPAEAEAA